MVNRGVGKLTIAKEIGVLTGFPLLHNHLTIDLVYSIYSWSNPEASLLKQRIRVMILDSWGKHGDTSIITTRLYKKNKNEQYFVEIAETVKKYDFEVFYIHLLCSDVENKKRVESSSRKAYGKITDWNAALKKAKNNNMTENVPFENNFEVDTTSCTPAEVAKTILKLTQTKPNK